MNIAYKTIAVGDVEVFHREAGAADASVLLLHGFPTSSHMLRELIPRLDDRYRVVAPGLPGFGNAKAPRPEPSSTRSKISKVVEGFADALGLARYALHIFAYGASTGLVEAVDAT